MLAITQARAVTTPEVQDVLATVEERRRTRLGAHGRSVCCASRHCGLQLQMADFSASDRRLKRPGTAYVAPRCARGAKRWFALWNPVEGERDSALKPNTIPL